MAGVAPACAVESADRPGRLPLGVQPVHYDIRVEPDAVTLTVKGRTSIDVIVDSPTQTLVVNALDLDVTSATVDDKPSSSITFDATAQTMTLALAAPLQPGPHRIVFDYSARIYPTATGLFYVDYPSGSDQQRMLTTQFEVGDARRFAPMWDEPAAKATFDLEVVVPLKQTAYSNMPVARRHRAHGKQVIRFATTPKMSSYLLHLTVGDLERVSRRVAGVDIGVVTRRGASSKGRASLDAAAEILPWYNEYFGTPYPLPKLDMIAVPGSSQFFGAMENWGAIMYFEPALLLDPSRASESSRRGVFNTVAHEMAHQWFGNLVTMNWWDELWLNEGYATWMAAKATSQLRPAWNSDLARVKWSREFAMQADAGDATHPIVQEVRSVDEASQAFDTIAYSKGSAVIGMLEATAGEARFREGIRRYMRKYAYGNAVTEKLWTELASATDQPLIDIARDFTLQPGVPLVKVETGPCADGRAAVTLEQGRFETGAPSAVPQTWRIPVRMVSLDNGRTTEAMLGKDGARVTAVADGCGPVVVNTGLPGYFRIQYSDAEFMRLRENFARLSEVDRLGLLNDTAALAGNGSIEATRYLDLSRAVPADSEPYTLMQISEEFASIDRLLEGLPQQAPWRAYATGRLKPMFDRIGWEPQPGEDSTIAVLRESLLRSLGRLAEPATLASARDRYLRSSADPEALPAALYEPVLVIAARNADEATWGEIHRRARTAKDPRDKQALYAALGYAMDPTLHRRALDLALSGEPPTAAVGRMLWNAAVGQPAAVFAFAVANEPAVLQHIDASSKWSYIPSLAATSLDPTLADEVQAYAERSIPADARDGVRRTVAEIRQRSAVRARQVPALTAWLAQLQ